MLTDIKLLLPYQNKWIALKTDRSQIVASGKTYKEVDSILKRKKIKDAILSFILPFDKSYSPNGKKLS